MLYLAKVCESAKQLTINTYLNLYLYLYRWASLTDSSLFLNGVKEGDAVGYLSADTSINGDAAVIYLYALAKNGNEKEQVYTNNTVSWSSDSSWLDAGDIEVSSAFRLIDIVNWNAMGQLEYGEQQYYIQSSDYGASGNQVYFVEATGGYGGGWNAW